MLLKQKLQQHLNNKKSCKIVELEQRVEILELKLRIANLQSATASSELK